MEVARVDMGRFVSLDVPNLHGFVLGRGHQQAWNLRAQTNAYEQTHTDTTHTHTTTQHTPHTNTVKSLM